MSTSSDNQPHKSLAAIILAAGKGTRMHSDLPKVLHPILEKPMVGWVVDAVKQAGCERVVLVIGHGAEQVKESIQDCEYVIQEPQLGTGHAVMVCEDALNEFDGDILVLGGDGPLLRTSTIDAMMELHRSSGALATLATSVIPDPTGYGRIVRDDNNRFEAIVEHKNATPEQLEIHEVYPSYAVFDAKALWNCLHELEPNELTNEYYLTEVPRMLKEQDAVIEIVNAVDPEDTLSINTPEQLIEVESILRTREANRNQESLETQI